MYSSDVTMLPIHIFLLGLHFKLSNSVVNFLFTLAGVVLCLLILSVFSQVGGIKPGCFKIGNTGGMLDNILDSKLYRPGRWVLGLFRLAVR